ncbi:MAG: hypothetical protein CHACPFDD_02365 [Phycisphaerae bacterium]|nr:hypothetical protein [Phycisphaerae bacterium]
MNVTTSHAERPPLSAELRDALGRYVDMLRRLAGPNLLGVTVYGAALDTGFDPRRQAAPNAVVLERVDLDLLRRVAEHGVHLARGGIQAPLIMTPAYIDSSRDTFPLELIEIADRRVTVVGEDYFAKLSFEANHVRLQCEHELKALLIRLRHGLLAAAGRTAPIPALLADACDDLLRVLRGMLWLKGQHVTSSARDLLAGVEHHTTLRLSGARAVLDGAAPREWGAFDRFYQDVEALGKAVNDW